MFFASRRPVVNTGAATRTARLAIGSALRENATPFPHHGTKLALGSFARHAYPL